MENSSWFDMQDELEAAGWKITDRIGFPDGHVGQVFPHAWTPEACITYAYNYVQALKRDVGQYRKDIMK